MVFFVAFTEVKPGEYPVIDLLPRIVEFDRYL
jgi:hypothetical protein